MLDGEHHCGDAQVQDGPELLHGGVDDQPVAAPPGVGDGDVQRPEGLLTGPAHGGHLRLVGDVADHRADRRTELEVHGTETLPVEVSHHHSGTLAHEPAHRGQPDARTAPRDERRPPRQPT